MMKRILMLVISGLSLWTMDAQAQEIITTYRSLVPLKEATSFADNTVVWVLIQPPGLKGGEATMTITSKLDSISRTANDDGINGDFYSDDGIYTGNFSITQSEETSADILRLGSGGKATIASPLVPGVSVPIYGDYYAPQLLLSAFPVRFSPEASFGAQDTTTISFFSNEGGEFEIRINGRLVSFGTMTTGSNTFIWDGQKFPEGSQTVSVTVWDEARNCSGQSTEVCIDNTPPAITYFSVNPLYFSPGNVDGANDYTWVSMGSNEDANGTVSIKGQLLSFTYGTASIKSTFFLPGQVGETFGDITKETVYFRGFPWLGRDYPGDTPFAEGRHELRLEIGDGAGNSSFNTTNVYIDNTPPRIDQIDNDTLGLTRNLNENILFTLRSSDWIGSQATLAERGEASVHLDQSGTISSAETVTKDKSRVLNLNGGWDQFDTNYPVGGKITIYQGTRTNTFEIANYNTINQLMTDINQTAFSGNSAIGVISYNAATDKFTIFGNKAEMLSLEETVEESYRMPFFRAIRIPTGVIRLSDQSDGTYRGYYQVPPTEGTYTWSIIGILRDRAGNLATNSGAVFGTISINGSQKEIVSSKIISLNISPNPNTTIFNLEQQGKITFKLTAADLYGSELLAATITSTSSSITILNGSLTAGKTMLIWDGSTLKGTNSSRIWRALSVNGAVTISNANLYTGEAIGDYQTYAGLLNLSDLRMAEGTFSTAGRAYVDIGLNHTGIMLNDEGINGDERAGDGIYTYIYTVKPGDDTTDGPVYGHFVNVSGKQADNDGYPFEDKITSNDLRINIDTVPPRITNTGATPIPFNPHERSLRLTYTLTEGANIKIEIRQDVNNTAENISDDILIGVLGPYKANAGDNIFNWDGRISGNICQDGAYYCVFRAEDTAGNRSPEVAGAYFRLSTVKMEVLKIEVYPDEFKPDSELERPSISFKIKVSATKKQLENLGFNLNPSIPLLKPYAFVIPKIYNSNGEGADATQLDYNGDIDSDPFPSAEYKKKGVGNYVYVGPNRYVPELIHDANNNLPDIGDGNKGNDYDALVPLDMQDPGDPNNTIWTCSFSYRVKKPYTPPPGTYIVRVEAELVSAKWKFVDYEKDPSGKPIREMWHEDIYPFHYGVKAEPQQVTFKVIGVPVVPTDSSPPVILATNPGNNVEVKPGDIKAGVENKENGIWAQIQDVPPADSGGVGVDFQASTIELKDPNGNKVPGEKRNSGDKIYYVIEKDLIIGGQYTIIIEAKDNRGNSTGKVTRSFMLKDEKGPEITGVYPTSGDYDPFQIKELRATLSELNSGKAGIDWDKCSISLNRDNQPLGVSRKSMTDRDENHGSLVYELTHSLSESGTYTMVITAYDKKGNSNIMTINFMVKTTGWIDVNLGTLTYLSIPPFTTVSDNTGTSTTVGTDTITIATSSLTIGNNLVVVGRVISFRWNNTTRITFTNSENKKPTLIMHYTDADVEQMRQLARNEDDLRIYGYNGSNWESVSYSKNVKAANNRVEIELQEELKEGYVLMYTSPPPIYVYGTDTKGARQAYLFLPSGTKVNNQTLLEDGQLTVGTTSDLSGKPDTLKVVGQVIQFFYLGNNASGKYFDKQGDLKMYYYNDELPAGVTKDKLKLYGDWSSMGTLTITESNPNVIQVILPVSVALKGRYALGYIEEAPITKETVTAFQQSVAVYPNPVKNGLATFRYNLERAAKVNIKVYTIMGQLVWDKEYNDAAGTNIEHKWELKNDSGNAIATGVYICRITADDGVEEMTVIKKLIVVQ